MKKTIACLAAILILAGCENVGTLQPVNAEGASEVGAVPHFTWEGTDTGSLNVVLPTSESLEGPFGPPYGNEEFGKIFKEVYGQYSTLPVAANNGTPTVATLKGGSMTMWCEFYNDDNTDHGFGGCKESNGALYRLRY